MCVKSYKHFAKCDHVVRTLTNCPTYHRQQAKARGLIGSAFWRDAENKKDCGKVLPRHTQDEGYCQACLVQEDGHDALRKQGFQEIFHEEQKEAARNSLQMSDRHRRSRRHSNHDVLRSETSVWPSDLYYHPETLAGGDTTLHRRLGSCPQTSTAGPSGRMQERQRAPAYSGPRPTTGAAATYQNLGHFPSSLPNLPPAVGPLRLHDDQPPVTKSRATWGHELRHKRGHIQRMPPAQQQQQQQQLDVPGRKPAEPRPSRTETEPGHWGTKAFSHWVDKTKEKMSLPFNDAASDVSFECLTSQLIANQGNSQSGSKGSKRTSRK